MKEIQNNKSSGVATIERLPPDEVCGDERESLLDKDEVSSSGNGSDFFSDSSQSDDKKRSITDEKKRREKLQNLQDMKGVLRKAEGILEVFLLSVVYYAIWRVPTYRADDIPFFYGSWKVVLVLIYAVLLFLIFYMCDSFKFGHRKLSEVVVSQ